MWRRGSFWHPLLSDESFSGKDGDNPCTDRSGDYLYRDYHGEIKIVSDADGKLVWECPNCGNREQDKMNVARRTCGYIGTQFWNQGRTQEIQERVLHL